MNNLSERIKELLKQNNLTVAGLEKKANLKANAVRNIFIGRTQVPKIDTIHAIAQALNCTIEDIAPSSSTFTSSSKACKIENFDLFLEVIQRVVNRYKTKGMPIVMTELVDILYKVYFFCLKKKDSKVDQDFLEWTIEENMNL